MVYCYSFSETNGYQQAPQSGSLDPYPLSVYNTETGDWTGAMGLLWNQPSPAPYPLNIGMVDSSMKKSFLVLAGTWGTVTATQSGNTLTYTNGTVTLKISYNANGICTELVKTQGTDTLVSVIYAEANPAPEPTGSDIPGPSMALLLGISAVTIGLVGLKKFRK